MKKEFSPTEIMGVRLIRWMIGLTMLGLILHLIAGPWVTPSQYWLGTVSYFMMLMTGLGLIFIWKLGMNKRLIKFQNHLLSSFLLLHLLFSVLYDPLSDSAVWVVFLFYPLIISLFMENREYLLWTLLTVPLYLYFTLQDPALYSPTLRIDFFIHRALFYLGSGAIGWNMIYLRELSSRFSRRREIMLEREAVFRFLEGMVPVVAEHSRSSPKEIEGVSFWMSRLLRHFPEQDIPEWEIRLLSLLHYVSKIKLPDYLFMKGGN
ncbi:membrane hypothetical protein [[Clostridium] ultunense Esp]|nr:membrane hypothetical protein [[Clostridium] ultunense Esp]